MPAMPGPLTAPDSPPEPASTSDDFTPDGDLEARLVAAIEPWLAHMTWRKDFDSWRERRIRQERYQESSVGDIRRALGGSLQGRSLLDLGAGMGGLSVALMLEAGEGVRLQALDYNPDYCRIAKLRAQRYGLDLNIAVAAGEDLPYPANSFDCVVCMDVLEHVESAERVLAEMWRVLRPGGVALTTVPNRHAFRDPHYHMPFINWLPRGVAERVIELAGRSKRGGPLHDRQELSALNTYTWAGFKRVAAEVGFGVRDQVWHRVSRGEIRRLRGLRRAALEGLRRSGLAGPLYRLYRYGWQGTYQILLVKPR